MATETLAYSIPAAGGGPSITVNAILTVQPDTQQGAVAGEMTVTGISGTYTANGVGQAITGLSTYDGGNNLVFTGGGQIVDGSGLSFTIGTTGGDDGHGSVNFYNNATPTAPAYMEVSRTGAASATLTPACYVRGTMIATDCGSVAVEDLAIGDTVLTVDGQSQPVRWIGRRSYAARFVQGQPHLLPIVIKRDALADNVPNQDLLVSPAHAMFIDGVLVPAASLVNGVSIVQDLTVEQIDYIHVELQGHGVIWANGAASETFINDDSRAMFHNAAEYAALYPEQAGAVPVYCAPRVTEGYRLDLIREKIEMRAGMAGRKAA